jgi:predicted phosphodiesterase
MRVALVSDMHGNAIAFDAVVRDLAGEQFDEVVCLGDVAQGGPQPGEVVDRLRELGWRCVFGNSDEFLLTFELGAEDVDEAEAERIVEVLRWSAAELGDERLAFLRSFEPTVELDLDGRRLVCCHATPTSNEEVILPETPRDAVERALGGADVVACGHVHLQWLRRVGSALWFCAGSAGLVYEHKEPMDEQPFEPWAEYAVLSAANGRSSVEFRRVGIDGEAVVAAIRASGMPFAEASARKWKTT